MIKPDSVDAEDVAEDVYALSLINKITALNANSTIKVDLDEVYKAILYAKKYHGSQKRLSGEPYYSHPLAVAELVSEYCFKTSIIVTSILHDIVEDTEFSVDMVREVFGDEVACNVEKLTRFQQDNKITNTSVVEFLYHEKNGDVLLVKLFDRLHNMKTIKFKSHVKQQKIALETLTIFLALSIYLNLTDVEQELYELCVDVMTPENKEL
jgi:(p)ppGpp synthase/HD superfamily hydrolase